MSLISLFIIFSIISQITSMDMMSGKKAYFELILDRFEKIKETPEMAEWNLKVQKVNKTRALVGNMILHVPLDVDLLMEVKVLKKQGGEYRYMPYGLSKVSYCEMCKSDKYVYPDFAKNSDLPAGSELNCPLPAGNYKLYGVTCDLENAPKMAWQSGEYALEIYYYKNDINMSCYRIYVFINNI